MGLREANAATKLSTEVGHVETDETQAVIEQCLRVARERLAMEIAWVAEFTADQEIIRVIEGEQDEWGVHEGDWLPLAQSYCGRMFAGEIPNAIQDTAREPAVASLEITRSLRIGSYIGVPLVLPS